MKKIILIFLTILIISVGSRMSFGLNNTYIPAKDAPYDKMTAMVDDNNYLGWEYFIENLPNKNPALSDLRMIKYNKEEHMLVWGNEHGDYTGGVYRYLGVNINSEKITNIDWPLDIPIKPGDKLDDNKWIMNPWESKLIKQKLLSKGEPPITKSPWDGDPAFLPNIVKGLQQKHTSEFRGNPELTWTDYVHILQPPTYYGWGVGRAWHIKDGNLLYRTIPLAPSKFHYWLPNFYVRAFDPGCPAEKLEDSEMPVYAAEPGETYTATVTFGINTLQTNVAFETIKVFVAAVHGMEQQSWDGILSYKSGNGIVTDYLSLWPFIPAGKEGQAVVFNDQDSEITATFNWTARADTKDLTAAINYPPALWLYYEGIKGNAFEDNVAVVPINIKKLPDTFVHSINPGTSETETGTEYSGTVDFGLYDTYDGPVKARLSLTHNGWPVTEIDGIETEFAPGEIRSFPFRFHGQAGDSRLEAKIWPVDPTDKDINWNNNSREVTVKTLKIDVGVENIRQECPVFTESEQLATVTVKNLGSRAETFNLSYFAGNSRIRTESITLEEGGAADRSFNWTAPSHEGAVELKVIADPGNRLDDINRSNNITAKTILVKNRGLPPTECISTERRTSGTWTESYRVITGHRRDRTHKWATKTVTYSESLSVNIKLDTKQGIPTDPDNPKPQDRESRGSWEIIPWAQANGFDPNKVTRAGYGFELRVATNYQTDYETKVPGGLHNTAVPKGGNLYGPRRVRAEFWDTENNSVTITELEPVSGSPGGRAVVWALPEIKHTFGDGSAVWERKHYVDVDNSDGRYYVVVHIEGVGKTGLQTCQEDYIAIHGDMYDDIYQSPDRKTN